MPRGQFKNTPIIRLVSLISVDSVVFFISLYVAFVLRFEGAIPLNFVRRFTDFALIFILVKIVAFYYTGIYRITWKYAGLPEVLNIGKASIISLMGLGTLILVFRNSLLLHGFPRSILFIDLFISFLAVSGLRLLRRSGSLIIRRAISKGERTLIVGAGNAGEQLLKNMLETENCAYLPVGFVDDDPSKEGLDIHGVKVLGPCSQIPALVGRLDVEAVIIAVPSASSDFIKGTVESVRKTDVTKIKILPHQLELISGRTGLGDVKDLDPEDLLCRQEVKIDSKSIESYIRDRSVLITGAAGSIGLELSRQSVRYAPKRLIILDQDETGIFNLNNELKDKSYLLDIVPVVGNIRDKNKVEKVFEQYRPEIVFHAAAYKHAPMMEIYPEEAIKTNIFGTRIVAEAAIKFRAKKFILISTDKAASPAAVAGATKRVAEMIITGLNRKSETRFLAVRFGNVLDNRGDMFRIFRQQIKEKMEVTITHPDMKRYFMSTAEAVLLVLQAPTLEKGDLFTLDMGKPVKIADFAKEIIRLYGYEPDKDIPIVFTGLKPEEKLSEEYPSAEDKIEATGHDKILSVEPKGSSSSEVLSVYLQKLEELMGEGISGEILVKLLKDIVPEYEPESA